MKYLLESLKDVFPKTEDNVTGSGEVYSRKKTFEEEEGCEYDDKIDEIHERMLAEINYSDYKNDESKTSRNKINSNINLINTKLREVEQMINHASKLKMESGVNSSIFGTRTLSKFSSIKERLNRLSQKIVEMHS